MGGSHRSRVVLANLALLKLGMSWVGAGQQASGGSATFSSAFLQSYQAAAMFFQCFAQIRGGRSPRVMEGRAGLYKKPFAAYSGALPGAQRLSLPFGKGSLHTALHCGSSCTGVLFPAPRLLTKTAETAGTVR